MADEIDYSILLVDDEPHIHSSVKRCLRNSPYNIVSAETGAAALDLIGEEHFDLLILDLMMPGMNGLTLMKRVRDIHPKMPVLILSGTSRVQEAVEAVQAGALDFIEKPFNTENFKNRIRQIYKFWLLERENERLLQTGGSGFNYHNFIGNSPAMLELKELISRIAVSDEAVLIQGETGTGKELVARALHAQSRRGEGIFQTIDCSSISETLIDSELFGHEKGAFTGASGPSSGLFRSAQGGSIFLDEIGELPSLLQSRLLRVLQEKTVRPVGAVRDYPVDIRVIAATNKDLRQEVREGRFREDLYYRLNVITLNTVPLRERIEDIPLLCRFFIRKFGSDVSPVRSIDARTLALLERYEWPGNVRELENLLRRAVAIGMNEEIMPADLPRALQGLSGSSLQDGSSMEDYSLKTAERSAVNRALQKCDGKRREAAALLGIAEATLYRKIKEYGNG